MAYKHPPITMKKVTIMMFFVTILNLCFSSCSKDDSNESSAIAIVGTTWEASNSGNLISLTFENSTTAKITETSGRDSRYVIYHYTYSYPNVTFMPTEDFKVTLYGTISNNTIVIENPTISGNNKVIYTLYKK